MPVFMLRRGGGMPQVEFGWNQNLASMPGLSFASHLSNNITEAQMMAGLSVSNGELVVDMQAMFDAGALLNAVGVMWLTGAPKFKAPAEVIASVELPASASTALENAVFGPVLYYYADDGPSTTESRPPGTGTGSPVFQSRLFGRQGSGVRGVQYTDWGSLSALTQNTNFCTGIMMAENYSDLRGGVFRQGNTYPPTTSATATTDVRNFNGSSDFPVGHRLRLGLMVRMNGNTNLPTIKIRLLRVIYVP